MKRSRIALVMPWVGKRPWYWELWRQSAAGLPFDIITVEKPLDYFKTLLKNLLRSSVPPCFAEGVSPYKLCDLKPLYGELFATELAGYDYWAFGDCDVLYGAKMGAWLRKVLEGGYDVATVQGEYCAGPFTIVRNVPRMNTLWRQVKGWEQLLGARQVMAFDELGPNWFRKHIYGGLSYAALREEQDSFSALVWREAKADRVKLLAEDVIDEHALKRGEVVEPGGDYVLYHFISAKLQFGFGPCRGGEVEKKRVGSREYEVGSREWGVGISRGKAIGDVLKFASELLRGRKAAWARMEECVARKCGSKTWWHQMPWNNR